MQAVLCDHLTPGMIVVRDVLSHTGEVIVQRGKTLTNDCIDRIRKVNVPAIDVTNIQFLMELKKKRVEQSKQVINSKLSENQGMLEQLIALRSHQFWSSVQQSLLPHFIGKTNGNEYLTRAEKIIQQVLANPKLVMPVTAIMNIQANRKYLCYVVGISMILGIELGLKDDQLNELGRASILYNFGYVTMMMNKYMSRSADSFDSITLSEDEMNEHAQVGYQAIKQFDCEAVALAALDHHERYDGAGKPFGKTGESISIYARIIAVARQYASFLIGKKMNAPVAIDMAYDYIVNDDVNRFDPNVVIAFQKWFDPFPNGICVELTDGSLGIVATQHHEDKHHPNVYITGSNSMLFRQGQLVSLRLFPDIHIKRIR